MANTKQAKKRVKQNIKRHFRNASNRSMMRTYIKKVRAALDQHNLELASEAFKNAIPVIDRMVSKGIIHKNAAARHKSRLAGHIKALSAAA